MAQNHAEEMRIHERMLEQHQRQHEQRERHLQLAQQQEAALRRDELTETASFHGSFLNHFGSLVEMSLTLLEAEWKPALTSILRRLNNAEYLELMNWLGKIPQHVKNASVRGDMPEIIIRYYGVEESIFTVDEAINKRIPRRDAAVQTLLRPVVEKMKSKWQKKEKGKLTKAVSEVLQKAAEAYPQRSGQTSTLAQHLNPFLQTAQFAPDSSSPADGAAAVKPKCPKVERKKPVKASSALVKWRRIKITAVKSMNTVNIHLVVKLTKQGLLEVYVTKRVLLEAFGFEPSNDVKEQIQGSLPLFADAKILGNKISELKKA
ncbi:uncharacterized protein KZ484_018758 [Pholidichthys leucotaenia]